MKNYITLTLEDGSVEYLEASIRSDVVFSGYTFHPGIAIVEPTPRALENVYHRIYLKRGWETTSMLPTESPAFLAYATRESIECSINEGQEVEGPLYDFSSDLEEYPATIGKWTLSPDLKAFVEATA